LQRFNQSSPSSAANNIVDKTPQIERNRENFDSKLIEEKDEEEEEKNSPAHLEDDIRKLRDDEISKDEEEEGEDFEFLLEKEAKEEADLVGSL
jgi:hypothetical protein